MGAWFLFVIIVEGHELAGLMSWWNWHWCVGADFNVGTFLVKTRLKLTFVDP